MPARNRLSIAYARVATPWQDLRVLGQTVLALASRQRAERIGSACLERFPLKEQP
jgi:hypothetical protein